MNRHIGTFVLAALAFGALAGVARPAPSAAQIAAQAASAAAVSAAGPRDEEFHYRWELGNLLGNVAGMFFPHRGEGALTFKAEDSGNLRSELVITSPGHAGEYWRYGAVIDPRRLKPIRAWSSYLWRGKSKSKSEELGPQGVMDVVSGIYSIRQDPPWKPRRMEIWSDGRIYPVVVTPLGIENRRLPQGTVRARHFSIRGVDEPGARRWKGKLDLWLTPDEWATPVEILISRNLADVRLQIQPPPPVASNPGR